MHSGLPSLQRLIRQLQKMPYLASKNVSKVATYLITCDDATVDAFIKSIVDARAVVKECRVCINWTEGNDVCTICASGKRDQSVICVVETWHDLWAIESAGGYHGVYHILGGALCPLEGIGPSALAVDELIARVAGGAKEIIFATNPTPEGEATASFIATKLIGMPVSISKLASGVPTGSSLEYMDRITISKALSGRRPF